MFSVLSSMMATPACSCLRVASLPLPLPFVVMVLCSLSLDEKYVAKSLFSSFAVVPYLVSVSTSMSVPVCVIQCLMSCRLVIAFMPLQLSVAILMLFAYCMGCVVCASCAV